MKKLLIILALMICATSCTKTERYKTPFDTGGKTYSVALLPWKKSAMNFDFKYRWTMTQALGDALKQSEVFELKWSSYPINGGQVQPIQNATSAETWERKNYGRYEPNTAKVREITNPLGADLAILYNVSSDNAGSKGPESFQNKDDYVRIFIVDCKTGKTTVDFIRTDFLRKRAYPDIKSVTLRALNKWLGSLKQ